MINEVLKYLNRYYKTTDEYSLDVVYTAEDTLTADFTDTFLASEYFLIEGTRLNDGVFKVITNNTTSLTIDTTIDLKVITEPIIASTLTRLEIPRDLLALIAEIDTFNTNAVYGITSESQGNRSISYKEDSSWQGVFSNRLLKYKRLGWC